MPIPKIGRLRERWSSLTNGHAPVTRQLYLVAIVGGALFAGHRLLHHSNVWASAEDPPESATASDTPAIDGAHATEAGLTLAGDRRLASIATPATGIATPVQPSPQWRRYEVKRGDTLSELFERAGFHSKTLADILAIDRANDVLRTLHPGDELRLLAAPSGGFAGLQYRSGPLRQLVVTRADSGLTARIGRTATRLVPRVASGEVSVSLSSAMADAGVAPAVVASFTRIFHWKIDFRRELRRGARFTVVYNQRFSGGKRIGTGPVIAARLENNGHILTAYRYEDDEGDIHYYDEVGDSLEPSILRTPVDYTRVSSPFSRRRWHPSLHIWRPHWGVDLAAPTGTPIRAAADGTVTLVARGSGYGRLVKIRHFGPYTTRYAHMHRFADGLHAGSHVHQGQVIGYAGESGEATGPHLHFEIRVNGKPHDPLKVALPDATSVPPDRLEAFQDAIVPLDLALRHPDERPAMISLASAFTRHAAYTDQRTADSADDDTPGRRHLALIHTGIAAVAHP